MRNMMKVVFVLLAACNTDYDRAKKEATDAWGEDALIQCEKVKGGWACENLCTHKVVFCPSESSQSCYFRTDINLITPAVSCPKAERRGRM